MRNIQSFLNNYVEPATRSRTSFNVYLRINHFSEGEVNCTGSSSAVSKFFSSHWCL